MLIISFIVDIFIVFKIYLFIIIERVEKIKHTDICGNPSTGEKP